MVIFKNCLRVRGILKLEKEIIQENNIGILTRPNQVKTTIMSQFTVLVVGYFLFELVSKGVIPVVALFNHLFGSNFPGIPSSIEKQAFNN
jgi:hypothetical protein